MKLNRTALFATVVAASLALTACGGAESSTSTTSTSEAASAGASAAATSATAESIVVDTNHGEVEVPTHAERVISLDNRTFEVLDEWGVKLVAAPKQLVPATVPAYKKNDDIVDLGNHREPKLEAMVAAQPDLIIQGQRFVKYYDDIVKLNPGVPVVDLNVRDGEPLDEELRRQVTVLGEVFGKEAEAKKLVDDFDAAIERARKAYDGEGTVMAVNVSGGEIGYIAPGKGRTMGPLFELLGLKPALEVENSSSNHEGDDISVETIAQADPKWILVLDRDGAIKKDGEEVKPAKDVISANAVLGNIAAVKEGRVIVAPADTYVNESIITYTKILNSIAEAFES